MRRLLILVSVLVLVDTMLYSALIPLLPHFSHELGLSKAGAGVLVAAYAAGALIGGLPGGRAATLLGSRRAVLVGLTLMGISSVSFAFADSFTALALARVAQGIGSAFTWAGAFSWLVAAAPRERRGEMIGSAMGAAVIGELLGPVLGVAASGIGRATAFSAVAATAVVLGVLTVQIDAVSNVEQTSGSLRSALSIRGFSDGLILLALAALLFGVMSVLVPLHLAAAGWGVGAIGAVWLLGAAIEAAQSPFVGRLSDRRGAYFPARIALLAAIPASLALAAGAGPAVYAPLVVVAGLAYGALFTPSFALMSDGAERAGLAQGMAFGLMNAGWACGALVGPVAAGAIAGATTDAIPWMLAALACAVTLALLGPITELRSTLRAPSPRGSETR